MTFAANKRLNRLRSISMAWKELPCEDNVDRDRVAVVINEHFDVVPLWSSDLRPGMFGLIAA